ncbi:MAG: hypothetical protein IAE99_05780 [Rhodothermales bacterium]|nr:hypothetical protein [Rhodothermales bacterium]
MTSFSLPLANDTSASFDLPGERRDDAILDLGSFADLADAAYDLEDTDPDAARTAYDEALLVAVYELGVLDGDGDASGYDVQIVQDIAAMLYNRAGARFDLDDLEGALEDLDASYAAASSVGVIGEDLADVLTRRAETKYALADVDGAFQDLDAALERHPDHALAFNNRAVYEADLGRMDDAMASIHRALDLDPENGLYGVTHAELLVQNGDDNAALDALERALAADPDAAALLDAEVFDGLRRHPRFQAL